MAPASDRNGNEGRRRVLLLPLPYHGHINPMLRLAAALHDRGLAVTVVHTETRAPDRRSLPAGCELVTVPDGLPPELAASGDIPSFVFALNRNCAAPFRDLLAGALRQEEEEEDGGGVACVVADVDWFAPLAAARELGVPALALMTSSAARFRVYLEYPRLCEKGYLPVQESNLDMPVDKHPPLLVRDLHIMMDTSRHVAYASLLAHIVAGVRQSSGLILNTFNAIERTDVEQIRRDTAIPVFPVGPLHMLSPPATVATQKSSLLLEDRSCLEWLNTQLPGSVLFVSFGTLVSIDADELLEVAWGLAASNRPFLWVIRPRLVRGRDSVELPSELLEETRGRGRIIRWAPQEEVLSHPAIGAFLTHCGWNSTLESISRTVPMICKPCGGDQLGTARYVCDMWKVGVRVEVEDKLTRGGIQAAIERLMDGIEGGVVRDRMREMGDVVSKCTTKGGSSDLALQDLVDFIKSS
uniref:Glycosyltransferase n=1 Tax=Oryza nivara TaxID=4536 RepID=A0A0E0J1H7_ORYNI